MSTSLIAYDRQRVIELRRAAVAASDHLARAPLVDDPLAADAVTAVRLVVAHLEEGWLPSLSRLADSQALIEPFEGLAFGIVRTASPVTGPAREIPVSWGPSNAVARSAADAAAGEPGRFVGRTQTYEVIETPPSTTLPNTGHDPDGGSGFYDLIVEDHWFHEHNLAPPPAPFGATPAGSWMTWLARLSRLAQGQPDDEAQQRGLAFERLAVEARGPGGKGGVGKDKNVAVGRLTTTGGDDDVIDYRAVSGKAERPGYVSLPAQPMFRVNDNWRLHTEVKILENAAHRLDPDDDGVVEIFTELTPCDSCRDVMAQFHAMFPNVQVRVYYREEVVVELSDDIDIDVDDWRGDLLWAIEDEQPDQVALLAPGHDLDFIDETSGLTPLMLAVDSSADGASQHGRPPDLKLVQTLLSCGASPTAQGRKGEDATDVARQYHWHEAIDAMHAADPDGVPRLFWPLGYVDRIPPPPPLTPDQDTPWRAELMDAIKRSDVGRVRALLANQEGTLDFIHPGSNLTPLELAIGEQRDAHRVGRPRDATVVRLLIAAGATPDFPPDVWSSPLSRAEGWPEVTDLLRAVADR